MSTDLTSFSQILDEVLKKLSISNIIYAAITLVICLLIKKFAIKIIEKVMKKAGSNPGVIKIVLMLSNIFMTVLMVLMVCSALGINTASFIALASVLTLGITFAIENALANVAGGIVLLGEQSLNVGEVAEIEGIMGTVSEITLTHTRLNTDDGRIVTVPNKDVSGNKIINYTRNGKRRIEITVSASYDAPTDTVRRACLEALERSASILDNPKPFVRLLSYDSSDIRYGLYFWVKPEDYVNVKFAINELIREKFNEKGIEMTYSHLNVHLLDQKE